MAKVPTRSVGTRNGLSRYHGNVRAMVCLVLKRTGPLIGLARVGGLVWLRELFGIVTVTSEPDSRLSVLRPLSAWPSCGD